MRHRPTRRAGAACAVLLASVLLASCSEAPAGPAGGAGTGGPAPTARPGTARAMPPEVPDRGLVKGLTLPLEAYMLNYADEVAIDRAEQQLTRECMKARGFGYDPPAPGGNPPLSSNDANMPRRYGISDPDEAAAIGYQVPARPGGTPSVAPIGEAERIALFGTARLGSGGAPQPGGCIGEARTRLHITIGTKASELDRLSMDRSLTTPEVQAAMEKWSACMQEGGYSYRDVYGPMGAFDGSSGAAAGPDELATAKADLACKSRTGLVEIWFATESGIQQKLIDENQLVLTQEKEDIAAALRSSAAVR